MREQRKGEGSRHGAGGGGGGDERTRHGAGGGQCCQRAKD
jgi:hypothetical protein